MMQLESLASKLAALAAGRTTSREMVSASLAAAAEPSGEGACTFTRIYTGSAVHRAESIDMQFLSGSQVGPLSGLPISIKDLFDVAGEPTTAGSRVLADRSPAVKDASVIERLRVAGAVLVGRTNMTEFAFSGLGINPHYGTPRNPFDRVNGRIPGGSSSGAAISVTDGMAAAGIGTDTGGSVRIPAALCGLTGFKPTARRVPSDGTVPLSSSLDSIGPIAPTVACCGLLDAVLSGENPEPLGSFDLAGLRVGLLQGHVLDGLDAQVARRYEAALSILSQCGSYLKEIRFPVLDDITKCNAKGGLAAYESYAWHSQLIEQHRELYDPRVLSRIERGREISHHEYMVLGKNRDRIIGEADRAFQGVDIWLLPTVPRIAPLISELVSDDDAYREANAAMLRNPSIFNFLDWCALSIPCHLPGEAPVGIMIAAPGNQDRKLLGIGSALEASLANAGCAIPAQL